MSRTLVAAGTLTVALLLGGCGGTGGAESGSAVPGSQAGPSAPSSPESGATTSPSTGPSTAQSGAPGAGPTEDTSATGAPGAEDSGCSTSELEASLGTGGGGGAGSTYPSLVLTNTGERTCTLTGFPGVSFVGDDNGTQLGAPAERDGEGTPTTITLAPGESAHSLLRIVQAGNFDAATCAPQPADGLRVYPPDQTDALFVPSGSFTACTDPSVQILFVRALEPGED